MSEMDEDAVLSDVEGEEEEAAHQQEAEENEKVEVRLVTLINLRDPF